MSLTGWCQFRVNRKMSEIICLGCLMSELTSSDAPKYQTPVNILWNLKFVIQRRALPRPPSPAPTGVTAVWDFDEYPENENRKRSRFILIFICHNINLFKLCRQPARSTGLGIIITSHIRGEFLRPPKFLVFCIRINLLLTLLSTQWATAPTWS